MIARLGRATSAFAARWLPDPFSFAIALTIVSFLAGALWGRFEEAATLAERALAAARAWYAGLWDRGGLVFALQMCLVLVTGHALALSPPVRKGLRATADRFRDGGAAVAGTAAVSIALAYLHWGLGLVAGGLLAREVRASAARRGVAIDYPLVVAAAYASLLVWHGGLSGSAPLFVAAADHPFESEMGVIPLSWTVFSRGNLLFALALLVALPLFARALRGREEVPGPFADEAVPPPALEGTPAARLDRSRGLAAAVLLLALGAAVLVLRERGAARLLDFDFLNFVFLFAGLALHGGAAPYARAVAEGAKGIGGIVLQFPFYFGILGVLRESGLVEALARAAADASRLAGSIGVPPERAFPILGWLSAAAVNFFVPSGGGQWAVQGPILVGAARDLGLPPSKAVLVLAYGDEWTNMVQPFWALALVGLTGVPAPRILGYSVALMLLSAPLFVAALVLG